MGREQIYINMSKAAREEEKAISIENNLSIRTVVAAIAVAVEGELKISGRTKSRLMITRRSTAVTKVNARWRDGEKLKRRRLIGHLSRKCTIGFLSNQK